MTSSTTSHPWTSLLKNTVVIVIVLALFSSFVLPVGRILVLVVMAEIERDGWEGIYLDRYQTTAERSLKTGNHTVDIAVSRSERNNNFDVVPVNIQLSVDGRSPATLTSTQFRDTWSSEPSILTKQKDVDGDRKKDILLQVDRSFYYISSQDGQGYQTDSDFANPRDWVALP